MAGARREVGSRAVGFDLDLTLVDTRARILASAVAAFAALGARVPAELIVPHLGVPLADKVAALSPGLDVNAFVTAYRELYHRDDAPAAPAMPGAVAALAAVRRHGDRALVVTAKVDWMGRAAVTEPAWQRTSTRCTATGSPRRNPRRCARRAPGCTSATIPATCSPLAAPMRWRSR